MTCGPGPWVELKFGDCLERMGEIADGSIDLICADLPYGTTACKWDVIIPFEPLWTHYKRVLKPRGAVVLTACQPFTSMLVMSNREWFKYCLVWCKSRPGGYVSARRRPLKAHEDIAVFSPATVANGSQSVMTYNPQGVRPGVLWSRPRKYAGSDGISYSRPSHATTRALHGSGYPRSVLQIPNPNHRVDHPTQKPVALMEYLIRTYSNESDTVLDNTMGSGTTGVACMRTGRHFVGMETNIDYFRIADSRIAAEQSARPLLANV